ncbi:MAG: TfoX family protein [Bradyrhizobium sp.]|nr:MAG: TfoX family protein [Bradyrhizobium sp.]
MDREGLEELFAPFGPVSLRRVFSGHGVYADDLCFALALRGEVFIKTDAETRAEFVAAGSRPFVYSARGREVTVGSYWRLVASAYDDEDELRRWSALGLAAARRAATAKAAKAKKTKAKSAKSQPAKATKRSTRVRPAAGSPAKPRRRR